MAPQERLRTMTMTRAQHLAWAKKRAKEAYDYGGLNDGIASMASDLGKHHDTRSEIAISLMVQLAAIGQLSNRQKFVEFIDGFN